jgi:hypothetical protein
MKLYLHHIEYPFQLLYTLLVARRVPYRHILLERKGKKEKGHQDEGIGTRF